MTPPRHTRDSDGTVTLTSDGHMTRRCLTFAFPACGDQGLGHVTRDIGAGHHAEEQCPHICWVVFSALKKFHPKVRNHGEVPY